MRINNRKQAGDTIVEVMVVLAVLGLAIGLSFAIANRSILATQGAQENSQATAMLQGQIESLRALNTGSSDPLYNPFVQTTPFCIDDNAGIITHSCTNIGENNLYKVQIQPQVNGLFVMTATWTDLYDGGDDTVTLAYRLHE